MKIVNIIGGLGNQMFQFAFALALKERWPSEEVMIDTSHFKHIFIKKWGASNLHNGYEIDKVFPKAKLPIASAKQIRKVSRYVPNYVLSRVARKLLPPRDSEIIQTLKDYFAFDEKVLAREGDCYYEGIWEAVSFIHSARNRIVDAYAHPEAVEKNAQIIAQMESEESVGIHVRRGDYIYLPSFMGICDIDYYKNAIERILEDGRKHIFYIFSNDMGWCEENIKPLVGDNQMVMVTHNTGINSCWDMHLMTHCKDLIIANSSFSWWGAFLNGRGGRVIAPSKWVNREAEFDVWLPEWIRV